MKLNGGRGEWKLLEGGGVCRDLSALVAPLTGEAGWLSSWSAVLLSLDGPTKWREVEMSLWVRCDLI